MAVNIRKLYCKTQTHSGWVKLLKESKYLNKERDYYNNGELVDILENRVADLLGKPNALFFHKGVTAQLVALKVASEIRNNKKIALHPQSHIVANEENAYQVLMGLQGHEVGSLNHALTYNEIKAMKEKIALLTVELPLRNAGFKLAPWKELKKMSKWCHKNEVHFHMDGARLWESTNYYEKTETQMSALFDSVYVSFYKGLSGIGGAVLAGERDFIEQCIVWRSRLGGDLYSAFPQLITALEGLDRKLPAIPSWVERAKEIAKELKQLSGLESEIPKSNGFLVFIKADLESLNKHAIRLNKKYGIVLFHQFIPTDVASIQKVEMQIGADAHEISTKEIVDYFRELINSSVLSCEVNKKGKS